MKIQEISSYRNTKTSQSGTNNDSMVRIIEIILMVEMDLYLKLLTHTCMITLHCIKAHEWLIR